MKICVYGAGAIGGHVAARLAKGAHKSRSLCARPQRKQFGRAV